MNIKELEKIPTFTNKETKGNNTIYHFRVKTIDKWYHHVLTVNKHGNYWWKSLGIIQEG
jgi:hypothetical protein